MTEHDHPDREDSGTPGAGLSSSSQSASGAGLPTWVKGFAIAAVALVLLIVIMLLTGHGPGRHINDPGARAASGRTPSSAPDGLAR